MKTRPQRLIYQEMQTERSWRCRWEVNQNIRHHYICDINLRPWILINGAAATSADVMAVTCLQKVSRSTSFPPQCTVLWFITCNQDSLGREQRPPIKKELHQLRKQTRVWPSSSGVWTNCQISHSNYTARILRMMWNDMGKSVLEVCVITTDMEGGYDLLCSQPQVGDKHFGLTFRVLVCFLQSCSALLTLNGSLAFVWISVSASGSYRSAPSWVSDWRNNRQPTEENWRKFG